MLKKSILLFVFLFLPVKNFAPAVLSKPVKFRYDEVLKFIDEYIEKIEKIIDCVSDCSETNSCKIMKFKLLKEYFQKFQLIKVQFQFGVLLDLAKLKTLEGYCDGLKDFSSVKTLLYQVFAYVLDLQFNGKRLMILLIDYLARMYVLKVIINFIVKISQEDLCEDDLSNKVNDFVIVYRSVINQMLKIKYFYKEGLKDNDLTGLSFKNLQLNYDLTKNYLKLFFLDLKNFGLLNLLFPLVLFCEKRKNEVKGSCIQNFYSVLFEVCTFGEGEVGFNFARAVLPVRLYINNEDQDPGKESSVQDAAKDLFEEEFAFARECIDYVNSVFSKELSKQNA